MGPKSCTHVVSVTDCGSEIWGEGASLWRGAKCACLGTRLRGAFLPLPHCLAALLIFLSATSWQVAGALAAAPAGTLAGAGQLGAYGRGRRISTALRHGKQEQGQGRKFRGRVLQDTGGGHYLSQQLHRPQPQCKHGPQPRALWPSCLPRGTPGTRPCSWWCTATRGLGYPSPRFPSLRFLR